jgi:transcriptional regulator with XRE-family HTH domain
MEREAVREDAGPAGGDRPLRYWRLRAGLTQRELAARSGVTPETVCRLEQGARPGTLRTWHRLSRVLGVDPERITEFRRWLERELKKVGAN